MKQNANERMNLQGPATQCDSELNVLLQRWVNSEKQTLEVMQQICNKLGPYRSQSIWHQLLEKKRAVDSLAACSVEYLFD